MKGIDIGVERRGEKKSVSQSEAMKRFISEVEIVVGRSAEKQLATECDEKTVERTAAAVAEHVYKEMLDKKLFQCCRCAEKKPKPRPPVYCASILVHTASAHAKKPCWFVDYRSDHEDELIEKLHKCFSREAQNQTPPTPTPTPPANEHVS